MNRRHRALAALLAALAIVFAQLAVAAHACEFPAPAKAAVVAPGHECCNEEGSGEDTPSGLCLQHCHYGEASFDAGQASPALADPAGPALRVGRPDSPLAPGGGAARDLAPPVASPPATILFGVLRI